MWRLGSWAVGGLCGRTSATFASFTNTLMFFRYAIFPTLCFIRVIASFQNVIWMKMPSFYSEVRNKVSKQPYLLPTPSFPSNKGSKKRNVSWNLQATWLSRTCSLSSAILGANNFVCRNLSVKAQRSRNHFLYINGAPIVGWFSDAPSVIVVSIGAEIMQELKEVHKVIY